MDDLLTPVSTTYLNPRKEAELDLTEIKPTKRIEPVEEKAEIVALDGAVNALKGQPDYDTLLSVLRFLSNTNSPDTFSFQLPGPKSAAIVHLLVTETAPNYWALLSEGSSSDASSTTGQRSDDAELFLRCLRSVTGLNAIIAQARSLIQDSKAGGKEPKRADISLNLSILLDILSAILDGDGSARELWKCSVGDMPNGTIKKVQSQQLTSILTNGRVVSVFAEALIVLGREEARSDIQWVAEGSRYNKWLGQNITSWARMFPTEDELKFCSDLFQRSLSLGYTETLVKTVIDGLLLTKGVHPFTFINIAFQSSQSSKKILHILLHHLSEKYLNHVLLEDEDTSPKKLISAATEVIKAAVAGDAVRKQILINWCASSAGAGLGDGIGIRRAVVAVLAEDREDLVAVFEKSLSQFGDELYIKHAAMLQQEVHTQILLLSAGYLHRMSPIKLTMLLRSGTYLRSISNRIAATQIRARFLGMVVGEALSTLVDNKEKKLDFHMEEMSTEEAQYLKNLTEISDPVGPIEPILSEEEAAAQIQPKRTVAPTNKPKPIKRKPAPKQATTAAKPRAIIQEVDSSGDEDEDDLAPYAKGSDPEDSEDEAELVQRNKPKPPVYIRELIKYLRDSESYDKQKLALQTAPVLIRRKANYGTEVSSHADELAGLLVGLQDKFEIEDFVDLRQQSIMALIVSQPKTMGPWFAKTFFEGDYSLSQRTSVLIALGLSARELAGFDVSSYQSAAAFPSKRLPEKLEQMYLDSTNTPNALPSSSTLKALPSTALDSITQSLTSSFLGPLAAEAADKTTGPDVLKLQSFTARYKSTTSKVRPRVRAIPNTTAALLATRFFAPLTAHFQLALRSARPLILHHGLLALYLQTLGVIIHAAGPATLALPQLTAELWDLLLGVRVHVLADVTALRGWFVALAALLEVNDADMQRVCREQGREVVETREWVGGVFERTRGEDGGEENDVKMLAAGVLIKLGEAIEKYQALLMGDIVGFV